MDTKQIVTDLKKAHLVPELKAAWHVALLKKDVMTHVAHETHKTRFGYYIIIASAVLGFLGMQIFGGWFKPSLVGGLIHAVVQAVMTVAGIYLVSFVAKKWFKGAAAYDQFFRVASYGMIISWLGILPQLSPIYGIWSIVISFVVLKTIHKLTTGGVIGTWIVSALIAWFVMAVLAFTGLTGFMGGYSQFGGGKTMDWGNKGFNFNIKGEDGKSGSVQLDENGNVKIKTSEGEMNLNVPK
jgi:hypothetical protein